MEKKTVKKTAKTAKKAVAKKPVAKKTETTAVAKDKGHLRKLIKAAIKKNGNRYDLNFIDVSHIPT